MSQSQASANDPPSHADLAGRQLGDYCLLRRLGRGAMAEVYLAEQSSLRRQVAVKVLRQELATDANYILRFRNEAQAAAALVHANIVQIHEVGCVDGVHYIAQEYVAGQNLNELLARRGPPNARLAMSIMRQVAAALVKAAEQGIIHRDIKPENIMLARSGEVKVADFGLARIAGDGASVHLTQIGVTMGTPLYMSPEQVEGRALDARSDIYSFGVTCYHMLSGEPPFRGETPLAVAVQHLKTEPPRLETARPDLPPALCRVVHKMLAKEPGDRYATPRDLLRELRALRIEGLDGDGAELAADLDDARADAMAAIDGAATQRLAALMRTTPIATPPSRSWAFVAMAIVLGLFAGAALARYTHQSLLGQVDPSRSHVPKQKSALAQYLYASTANTEEAWLAVSEHWPNSPFYTRLAQQQLARLYLLKGDNDRAYELFDKLANLDEVEKKFRAFGLAGKCVMLSYRGDHAGSAAVLAELMPLREQLDQLDIPMRRMLQEAIDKNRQAMSRQQAEQWDAWLARQTEEELSGDAPPELPPSEPRS
ncbi:MAG: serine/threonine protein kinase [Pirellulales bacterium]|nr:serine/threonine protein kinase [Pirellulales bacterium]